MLPCSVARLNTGIYFCYLVVLFGVTNECLELILCSRKFIKLMISIIRTGSSVPGSSPGGGHFVVFKTLNSNSASLHPGV